MMNDIQAEIKEFTTKLDQIADEIAANKEEVSRLQQANAKVVELHIGKTRKPPSLLLQRKKIASLTAETEELVFLQASLGNSLKFSQKKLVETSHKDKIQAYKKAEANQLESYRKVQSLYQELLAAINQVGNIQHGHCLSRLAELAAELGPERLASSGVDVNLVLSKFAMMRIPGELDVKKIESINLNLTNLGAQLKAIALGKRTYSKVEIKRNATAPQVTRSQSAQLVEQYRQQNIGAIERSQSGRKQIRATRIVGP
jgi:hypothetical protein